VEKALSINTEITAESTISVFDKQRLFQVLVNIISNAIKFSEKGKTIQIQLLDGQMTNGNKALCLRVTDEGPGIPESELGTVFDKFSQSSTTKTGAGGTGLGLAICQEIVEAHGGEIWAENEKTGGAVFCFSIPQLSIRE
jgi:signal transduction histidine kinase